MIDTDKLREIHDIIKNHPYWERFDKSFVRDLIKMFSKMDNIIYGDYGNTFKYTYDNKHTLVKLYDDPYYPLFTTLCHDFRGSLWRLSSDPGSESHTKGITYLQMFLQIVHCYLDNLDVPRFPLNSETMISTKELDGKYHILFVYKRSKKPALIAEYRKYQQSASNKEKWEEWIKEIEDESYIEQLWED